MATLFEDQKRFGDAEKLFQEALAIYRAALGENRHLDVATAYSNLGSLYEKGGDLARAETMMLSANQVMLQVFDRDHPRRVTVLEISGRSMPEKRLAEGRGLLSGSPGILQRKASGPFARVRESLQGQSLTRASESRGGRLHQRVDASPHAGPESRALR